MAARISSPNDHLNGVRRNVCVELPILLLDCYRSQGASHSIAAIVAILTSKPSAKSSLRLVKAYRVCLQKYEDNPTKAKESCGVYREALHDLAPPHDRRTIGEMLDRLFLEKER
jgi:hypothetical protein